MNEWDAVRAYFSNGVRRMVDHQVDSYEDFVRHKIPLIIQSTPPITVWHEQDETLKKYKYEFKLSFENISYIKPRIQEATGRVKPMLPMEARIRNFTYAAQMYVDIRFIARTYKGPLLDTYDEESHVFEGISLGKLPVMLGSSLCLLKDYPMSLEEYGECAHDPLGYFIIHGSERTILCQEKVADNRIMIFQNKKSASKHTHSVEIKSLHESFTMPPKKLEIRLSSKFNGFGNPLTACVPRFREDIPVVVYFRALGVLTDRAITRIIWGSDEDDTHTELLAASFRDASELGIFTQQEAIQYLTNHLQYGTNQEDKCAYVRQLLNSEFLPHVRFAGELITTPIHNSRKVMLMGAMIRRLLLTYCKQIPLDDRDAYPNKRVVTTGALLTHLFRQLFQKVCNDTRNEFVQEVNNDSWKRGEGGPRPMEILNVNNLYKILKLSAIEGKLKQALATGNFTVQGLGASSTMSNATKVGVSQVLARMSYAATLSHLRRIQTPVEKSGKLLAPRKLHGTSWGFMCPVETPEGHSVGIVKNMSLLTSITQHVPSTTVLHYLQDWKDITWIDTPRVYEGTSVTVNGVIVGYTKEPYELVTNLRTAKQTRRLHPHISVAWYTLMNSISIETDGGRCVRPVFRADAVAPKDTTDWSEWCTSAMDYIDSSETETLRIAMSREHMTSSHTHHEVHPSLIVGHMASTIPLSDHNQSPRNTYQSAMGKQAMCVYAGNFAKRLDKNAYILCSIARPIVETRAMNILKMHEMPFGMNAIVAIACYGGYNQEDSVIMNKSAVERGFFRGLYYGMYKDEEHRNVTSGREEKFMKPMKHNTRKYKNTSYAAISDNGLPIINSIINENDVLIGKVVNLRNDAAGYAFRDASTTHKNSEQCRIDGVWQDKNSDGYPFIKVRTVSERIPQIGDKVSSRHGQKGTIGMLMEEEDMPFTSTGLRPDIIMNPHAVPSRMTIAQLMENIFGKIGVRKGTLGDGTPYSHLKVEDLKKHMVDMGMHPYGNEILYNGQTGEMMQAEIFMGPTFYQRLKHMVIDKKHSRARGPIVSLTRQPCEGRSRDGGLRVGEMERDCMLSHGISVFTKERLMDVSDPFKTGLCKTCGTLAIVNPVEGIYSCGACGNKTDFVIKTIPYAMKLWMQELEAMHITPKMILE
jgi:DNA-directed RNA polymerase II subunit RPB2